MSEPIPPAAMSLPADLETATPHTGAPACSVPGCPLSAAEHHRLARGIMADNTDMRRRLAELEGRAPAVRQAWRVGSVGRTIYLVTGAGDGDPLIGVMDTPALAAAAVNAYNATGAADGRA